MPSLRFQRFGPSCKSRNLANYILRRRRDIALARQGMLLLGGSRLLKLNRDKTIIVIASLRGFQAELARSYALYKYLDLKSM